MENGKQLHLAVSLKSLRTKQRVFVLSDKRRKNAQKYVIEI